MYSWQKCSSILWIASSLDWLFSWPCRSFHSMRSHLSIVLFLSNQSVIQKDSEYPFLYPCHVLYCLFNFSRFYHSRFQMESFDPLTANFCRGDNVVYFNSFVYEHSFSNTILWRVCLFSIVFSLPFQISDDCSYKYFCLRLLFYPIGPLVYFFYFIFLSIILFLLLQLYILKSGKAVYPIFLLLRIALTIWSLFWFHMIFVLFLW